MICTMGLMRAFGDKDPQNGHISSISLIPADVHHLPEWLGWTERSRQQMLDFWGATGMCGSGVGIKDE